MKRLTALFPLTIALCTVGHCATTYVAPDGNDDAAGTSLAAAWKTVNRAVQELHAGDTVVLADGVYREKVRLDGVDWGEQPITFRAQNPGRAIIDAAGEFYCLGTDGTRARNLVLEGLKLQGGLMGVGLDAGADGLTVRGCEITGAKEAIRVRSGSDLLVSDCQVHDNESGILVGVKNVSGVRGVRVERTTCTNNCEPGRTGNRDGVAVEGMCTGVVITDCVSSGAGDAGFDLKPDATVVERCRAFDNGQWGVKLWGTGSRVINCLFSGNAMGGLAAAGDDVQFWNCTFGPGGKAGLRLESKQPRTCVIRNTIFYRARLQCLGAELPDEDYNCFCSPAGEAITTPEQAYRAGVGQHDLAADPLFADVARSDYRLTAGSPCRGKGLANALVEVDLMEQRRTGAPDLGAL